MDNGNPSLRKFLEIPYDALEKKNLLASEKAKTVSPDSLEKEYRQYLEKEKRIKAVTLLFSDIEGRLHMLDYDKKYLLSSSSNLTFDGSSVKGFSTIHESDLRLKVDWPSFRFTPADVFGPGKVFAYAFVYQRNQKPYESDFRERLTSFCQELKIKRKLQISASAEVEGFLVEGINAEQEYDEKQGFKLISSGGYYHSLPLDRLRTFIDRSAEAQRAMGFRNEKDHPEVAPSQFELNFSFSEAVAACDLIQLYKLICRQVARNQGITATFLPKPLVGVNGSGMHINLSFGDEAGSGFFQKEGRANLSSSAWDFISKILNHASEICLILNSSVNAYRRLDPNFEAPNQIRVSPVDRSAMIRIPEADKKTARIEVRSVAPDSNPYLVVYTLLKAGFEGKLPERRKGRERMRFLPGSINDAIRVFKASNFISEILGEPAKEKYVYFKEKAADRSPKELGKFIKTSEVIYHHEVTNQLIWSRF